MSVMVVGKFKADPARMASVFRDRKADVVAVSDYAKAHGALHHHFAMGDGQVMVIDEWENAESFQQFFSTQSKVTDLMREAGVEGEPEFAFYPIGDMPGQF
jgi:heme-degrading monooxygenase HmoA